MAELTRSLGFTNSIQRLVWPRGNNIPVTAYLWGGGGGGGGNDSGIGGAGSGGGFSKVSFFVNEGDVIDVAVGGAGGGGASRQSSAPGGSAGASIVSQQIFDTRSAVTSPPVIASTNTAYVSFLNTYGVWVNPTSARNFDRSYVVNFPFTGVYTLTTSCDNFAEIYIDDAFIGTAPGFKDTYALTATVDAGNRILRIIAVNTGGPGSVAVTINGGTSYSGGRGGRAGPSGSSGGGGGGGGATVLLRNGVPVAIAGGGGGGGGAGNRGTRNGDSAPGTAGHSGTGINAGQNGQQKSTDGGGGGGGGGGDRGGNGGFVRDGDQGAFAGAFGISLGENTDNPANQNAANRNNEFYVGSVGSGGSTASNGTSGYAVLTFDVPGIYVHGGTSFQPVQQAWIKNNDVWQEIRGTYIKINDIWVPVQGSQAPDFVRISGNFGISSRSIDPEFIPAPPDSGGDGWVIGDFGDGGSGGSKIICAKLHELGLMDEAVYRADQAYGALVAAKDPVLLDGYHYWANIVVDWMSGSGIRVIPFISKAKNNAIMSTWSILWAKEIATPWAKHMHHLMGGCKEDSRIGRALMAIGTPLSRLFANKKKQPTALTAAGCIATFGILYVFVNVAKLFTKSKGVK
jgi:hypothetical protein